MPNTDGSPLPGEAGYVAPANAVPQGTSGGLLNSSTSSPVASVIPATAGVGMVNASGYTASPYTVTGDQTVAQHVRDIIREDSPLMQQAASRAAQQMNERGLLNSSIAVNAGQNAILSQALPIAQQDAGTYATAATNTANAKNAASQFGAAAENTASSTNAQLGTSVSLANAGAANTALGAAAQASNTASLQTTIATLQANTQKELQRIQSDTTLSVADKQAQSAQVIAAGNQATQLEQQRLQTAGNLEAIRANGTINTQINAVDNQYKALLQTSSSAAAIYQQAITNMAAIIRDPNVTDKTGALNDNVKQLNDALATIGSIANLNLGSTLTFSAPTA